ncbi:MAG: succinate-semialdehyde dehydrogenase/glutarate-semialdehyde dehydrogenase, partial [Flavobacteriales bacterium]
MLNLLNQSLLCDKLYINGEWVGADSSAVMPVLNPATKEKIIDIADAGASETQRAIAAADVAFQSWRKVPAKERGAALKRWFTLIMDNQADLAQLMTAEQGKPLAESAGEVAYGASFVEWFAEEGRRVYGDIIASNNPT